MRSTIPIGAFDPEERALLATWPACSRFLPLLAVALQLEILIRLTISVVSDLPGLRIHEGLVHGRRGHSSPSEVGNERLRRCCC